MIKTRYKIIGIIIVALSIFFLGGVSDSRAQVVYDATSESHTGTTGSTSEASFNWTHTPSGTPAGVVVFVYTVASSGSDTGVNYGASAMSLVSGGAASDTVGEPGTVRTYFLGTSVPTGAQTVTVNRTNNSNIMYAIAFTVTAGNDTAVNTSGIVLLQENQALAEQNVDDGSPGVNSVRFAGAYNGGNSPGTAGTNSTLAHSIDLGSYGAAAVYETTAGQGSRPVGVVTSNDDAAEVLLAVYEVLPTINLSGKILQTNESSDYDCSTGGPYTVRLRVDGSGSYTADCTASTGNWSVTGVTASSGQTVYVYIYGETPKGSTVLVSDGTTKSDVNIFQDRVVLRDDVNGSITNTEVLAGNTADADDLITTSGTDVTVGSSYETHIYTGDTYAPGANVETGKLHVVGNYSGSTETLLLTASGTGTSRPLYVNGGTFTDPTTTTFQGTAATDIEATTYTDLNFTPTITGAVTYTLLGAVNTDGDFTVNPTAASTQTLTVDAGGTITVAAGKTTTLTGTTSGESTLDLRPVSTDYDLSTGLLDIAAAGTLDATGAASTITLTGTSGTLFTTTGTFTEGSSTVVMNPDAAVTLFSANPTLYNLSLTPTITASRIYTVGSALTINGDFTINPGTAANALTVNMGGDITVAAGKTTTITRTTSATSTLDTRPGGTDYDLSTGLLNIATGATLDAGGSASLVTLTGTSGTLFTLGGTFTAGSSTVTFTPDAAVTLFSAQPTLYNLSLTPTITAGRAYTVGAALTINGDFTVNPSAASALALTVNMGGDITAATTSTTTISGSGAGPATSTVDTRPAAADYDISMGLLDVAANGTLDATGSASIFTLSGTSGTLFTRAGAFNQGSSSVTVTSASGTPTFNSGTITFYDLTINASGATVSTSADTLTINNNLSIDGGTLTQSGAFTVAGTAAVAAGTTYNVNNTLDVTGSLTTTSTGIIDTTAGTPTVTVQGTNIGGGSGAITFYALTKSGAGTTTFSGSGTNTINNNLSVSAGTLTLSDTLTVTGDGSVATGATLNINASLNVNGGALTTAGTGIINTTAGTPNLTISGTGNLGGGDGDITLHQLTTTGSGATTFSGSGTNTINDNVSVGSGTTLNINDDVSIAGTLTNTTTGIIGTSAGTPTITLTGTGALGGGSGAITFHHLATSGTGTFTFTGSGTNTANGNITVGSGTTLNINDSISIAGTLTNTTTGIIGTSAGTPTVTLTGTGNLGSGSGAITFHHLTTSGTGTHNFSGSGTITVNGNVTIGSGTTLNLNSDMSVAGNIINTTTGVVGYSGTPTVTVTGSSNSIGGGSGTIDFYALTISGDGTYTVNSDTDIVNSLNVTTNDTLTIAASQFVNIESTASLTFPNTAEIDGTGTLVYRPTTNFPTTGTMTAPVQFDSTAGAQTLPERTYVGNVELYNNSGVGRSYQLGTAGSQTLTFSGDLTLDGTSGTVTVDADTHDPIVNVSGDISYTAAGSAESITTGTSNWTVGGNVNFTNGTFTATATNTFIMNGSSDSTADLTSNGQTFQNFEVQTNQVTSQDTMDVDGTFDVSSSGTFVHGGGADSDLYVADDFTLASGTTFTWNSEATSQLIFDGDLFLADNTAVKQNLGDVVIGTSPDTTYLSDDTSSNSLTVTGADFYYTCGHEVDIGNGGITIDGTFDATSDEVGCSVYDGVDPETTINDGNLFNLSGTGTFVPDQSTIIFDDSSGTNDLTTAGSGSFYNMEINGASNTMLLKDALDVDNNLTITAGTLDTETGNGWQINVGGNWDNDAAFEARGGLVIFDAQSGTPTIDADGTGTDAFFDIQFNDGPGTATFQLTEIMDVDNNFTITDGTVDANGKQINVGNNWSNSGIFTSNSNNVVMDGQDAGNTLTGTMTGGSSFYNLTFDDSVSSGAWTFAANPATVTNDFVITGGAVTAPSTTLTIGGIFTNNDSFVHNSGTIVFNDSGKTSTLTYAATTIFNNFTVATGGKQMEFDNSDGVVTDIDGALSLQGSGCGAGMILLDPDSPGLVWDIAASGSVDIDYVDVEYSTASPALTANSSTEQNNNNTGWTVNEGACGAKEVRFLDGVRVEGGVRVK